MIEVMYSPERLKQVRKRAEAEAARRPAKRETEEGFRVMRRIPKEAHMNAVLLNGGVMQDGTTCWDDPEFCADMERMYPECAVKTESGKIMVGSQGAGAGSVKKRNRFGNVSFHKVYG